jgi:hypothetical protein
VVFKHETGWRIGAMMPHSDGLVARMTSLHGLGTVPGLGLEEVDYTGCPVATLLVTKSELVNNPRQISIDDEIQRGNLSTDNNRLTRTEHLDSASGLGILREEVDK